MMLLFVSNGNLTLLFFSYKRLQLIKSDESLTFVHTVRINKLEANLAARPTIDDSTLCGYIGQPYYPGMACFDSV